MGATWHSKQFEAQETIVGHGTESIGRQAADFLNSLPPKKVLCLTLSSYETEDMNSRKIVRGLLLYLL